MLVLEKATLTPTLSLRQKAGPPVERRKAINPLSWVREKPNNPLSWGRGLG
jgi:hypothetical protein